MSNQRVLFDGWELVHAPLGPPALHVLDLLAHFPDAVEPEIALPSEPPGWLQVDANVHVHPTPATPAGRLRWEQRLLPRLASARNATLHSPTTSVAWTGSQSHIVSPAREAAPSVRAFRTRLRQALGRGGTARARLLWPADVPSPAGSGSVDALPPAVHPDFSPKDFYLPPEIPGFPELPASFFLVHIRPEPVPVRRALEAWTWAAGPIGEVYPLVFLGLPEDTRREAEKIMARLHLGETVQFYPPVPPTQLHLLYQAASAIFHPAPIDPWSSPLRYGIACAKPVVGIETALAGHVAGPAAYLASADDPRGLGAALISVIVRDDIRKQLVDHARKRAANWSGSVLKEGLERIYT